jgi:hypothetical protein
MVGWCIRGKNTSCRDIGGKMNNLRKKLYDYDNNHEWVYVAFFCFVCLLTFTLGRIIGPWAGLIILGMIALYGWIIWPKKEYFSDD